MKQKVEIAADLVRLKTVVETFAAPQNKLDLLLHPLMELPLIESTHRIHRGYCEHFSRELSGNVAAAAL